MGILLFFSCVAVRCSGTLGGSVLLLKLLMIPVCEYDITLRDEEGDLRGQARLEIRRGRTLYW